MEDDLQWKTTFDGRQPSMEDDLQWKTTFNGRQPSSERFRDSALPYTAVAVMLLILFINFRPPNFSIISFCLNLTKRVGAEDLY